MVYSLVLVSLGGLADLGYGDWRSLAKVVSRVWSVRYQVLDLRAGCRMEFTGFRIENKSWGAQPEMPQGWLHPRVNLKPSLNFNPPS